MLKAVCDWYITAIKAVTVVPIFAPKTKGITFFKEVFPVATKGTIKEVVIELD